MSAVDQLNDLAERLNALADDASHLSGLVDGIAQEVEQQGQSTYPAQSRFERCLKFVLKWEGGYVDHPDDPGGPTNKGITLRTYQDWSAGVRDAEALQKIGPDTVEAIYKARYWDVIRGDDLPVGVDLAVFDMAVHSGPARSVITLQRILGVVDDGIVGPVTLGVAKRRNPGDLALKHADVRRRFLEALSTWKTFGPGWTNRLDDLTQQIKEDTQA